MRTIHLTNRAAFTLLEFIGVVAVLALVAAMLAPVVIKRMDRAALTRETADLAAMAEGLEQHILRNQTIPAPATLAQDVGNEMSLSAGDIATTPRQYNRVFLADPSLQLGGGGLPYTQTTNGTPRPFTARLMMISTIAKPLPTITSGQFNNIWDTPEGTTPSGWTTWTGQGEDLRIKRINLEPLFHQLILINHDDDAVGQFSIGNSGPMSVPTNGLGWNSFYLDGTVIGLHDEFGAIQARDILKQSISYVFEFGKWRGQVLEGRVPRLGGLGFGFEVEEFLNSPLNPGARFGGTQQAVVDQIYSYMFIYTLWANDNPCFARHLSGNLTQVPHYQMLLKAQPLLDSVSVNLIQ